MPTIAEQEAIVRELERKLDEARTRGELDIAIQQLVDARRRLEKGYQRESQTRKRASCTLR